MLMKTIETEVLVVGEGSAGLTAALAASEAGVDVLLLYSAQASSTAISTGFLTYAAHDGFKQDEVFHAMAETTGKGLCDTALLKRLVEEAPIEMAAILERYDVPTEVAPKGYRVRRATGKRGRDLLSDNYGKDGDKDMTGLMMEFSSTHGTALFSQLRKAAQNSNIQRIRGLALSLSSDGPSVWADIDGELVKIIARAVILATGGMQGVYEFTDTPRNLLGDGQAMALEAGAELVDMEFIQFYPLAVNEENTPAIFLYPDYPATARLINSDGEDIIAKYMAGEETTLAALHNWDFLSAIIHAEMVDGRDVFIDFTQTTDEEWAPDSLTGTFLAQYVKNYRTRPVRIAPSSHYTIGGIRTDINAQTSIPGVYACGEVAGGLHGANRHGGTALVEAMTFGRIAGRHAAANLQPISNTAQSTEDAPPTAKKGDAFDYDGILTNIRRLNQRGLGAARSEAIIQETEAELLQLCDKLTALGWSNLTELRQVRQLQRVSLISLALCRVMLRRQESRGTHIRIDFPEESAEWRRKQAVRLDRDGEIALLDIPV